MNVTVFTVAVRRVRIATATSPIIAPSFKYATCDPPAMTAKRRQGGVRGRIIRRSRKATAGRAERKTIRAREKKGTLAS